ncbi:hypothetical protein JQ607_17095 [Bradyrhizobium liaoningense]|uniref:hypothetical protein n=1 Tax=Bradyrhizobium liaoningense TaxID=43992 RepID=UPI001BA851CF|nr:hypothetical protein [Bradyrhizobium liaoningense]MBR0841916.1 hypothetical protein [Bradyrhizobium liaoningense]
MRAAVLALLLILPFSASAQTPQEEQPSVARFRACVRSHAPDAQAAGVRTAGEIADYFIKVCAPLFGIFLGSNNTSQSIVPDEETLPPGIYRKVMREEWSDFVERGNRP